MTSRRPYLITTAELSPEEQLRIRQVRYATMMGIRVVCLLIAAILVTVQAPLLWLWIPMCLIGMVLLPWMAVIIANDRLPKEDHRLGTLLRNGFRRRRTDRDLTGGPATDRQAIAATEQVVIDPDEPGRPYERQRNRESGQHHESHRPHQP